MARRGKIFKNNPNLPLLDEDDKPLRPSKSAQKRGVQQQKELALKLATLPVPQIKLLPVDDEFKTALLEYHQLTANEARRRHEQLLGKLMRGADESILLQFLTQRQGVKMQAQIEKWRGLLLEQGEHALAEFARVYAAADRHALRQIVLLADKANEQGDTEEYAQLSEQLKYAVQQMVLLS